MMFNVFFIFTCVLSALVYNILLGPMPMQYMPGMNYAMNQPFMNQQMNMNMMQNMYLMQQQMQNNPVISLRSPDIHNIVQRVKALVS